MKKPPKPFRPLEPPVSNPIENTNEPPQPIKPLPPSDPSDLPQENNSPKTSNSKIPPRPLEPLFLNLWIKSRKTHPNN